MAVFDVQGNQMLPSYQVSSRLAFCFRRRSNKIDFQDGGHGMLISDWNYFNFFDPRFKSTDLSVQEKKRKTNFQDGVNGGQLGLQIGKIFS